MFPHIQQFFFISISTNPDSISGLHLKIKFLNLYLTIELFFPQSQPIIIYLTQWLIKQKQTIRHYCRRGTRRDLEDQRFPEGLIKRQGSEGGSPCLIYTHKPVKE